MHSEKTVATPCAEYGRAAVAWPLVRALMGGTRAMRAAGEAYLPKEPAESDAGYKVRLNRSTLFNGLRKTARDMTGKVFAKPIALGEDMPEALQAAAENVDLTGRSLDVFARHVFEDAMQVGIGFILVDAPEKTGLETRADEEASGFRPYLVHIRAEDLIGWKSATIAGKETLTQIRFRERVAEPSEKSPWEDPEVEQIRVLNRETWETYRQNDRKDWVLHDAGVRQLQKITLAPVYLNRTGFMLGAPPLEDLADINVAHWQSQSDQRNILHVARVPILFGSGFSDEQAAAFKVGANSLTFASDPASTLSFVEHSGAAIGAGREDLQDLEFKMQTLGLELLLPKPGSQTATGAAIDQAAMHAPLALMALALKDALEQAFGFMAEYAGLGEDAGGSLTVNTDFGVSMRDAADLTALLGAVNAGHITRETFLKELIRRGVLSDDLDPEDEVGKLETEPVALQGEAMELPGQSESEAGTSQDSLATSQNQSAPGPTLEEIRALIESAFATIKLPEPAPAPAPAPAEPAPPPVINVTVDVPPQQPPVVNVEVAAPDVNVAVDAKEGRTITTVLEKDEQGGIKRFVREPAPEPEAEAA